MSRCKAREPGPSGYPMGSRDSRYSWGQHGTMQLRTSIQRVERGCSDGMHNNVVQIAGRATDMSSDAGQKRSRSERSLALCCAACAYDTCLSHDMMSETSSGQSSTVVGNIMCLSLKEHACFSLLCSGREDLKSVRSGFEFRALR